MGFEFESELGVGMKKVATGIILAAQRYVDSQMETMRKHGSAPELSPEEYRALVEDIYSITMRLRARARRRKIKDKENL